jgi:glycerophosphoryl diester phosphodiesterase
MNYPIVPKLVAHRGDNKNFPENSYKGIEAVLKAGVQFVEFDVQMTADKQLIVHHDIDLIRTAKQDVSIFEHPYNELKKFSIHESTRFNNKHYPTPISLLSEVLELLQKYPHAKAFVEIKTQSLKQWGRAFVMDALLKQLQPYTSQCVIISFSSLALRYAQRHSDLPVGWVVKNYNKKSQQIAIDFQPDYLICDHKKISAQQVLWDGNWQWMLYSINHPEVVFFYAQKGVEFIETDAIQCLQASSSLWEVMAA